MAEATFWEKFSSRPYLSYFFIFFANIICWQGSYQAFGMLSTNFTLDVFIFTITTIVFSLLIAELVDNSFKRRKFILLGFILYLLGFTIPLLSFHGISLFGGGIDSTLVSVILGMAFGISTIPIGAYFGDISHPQERGKLQGLCYCIAFAAGFVIIILLTPYIMLLSILLIIGVGLIAFLLLYSPFSPQESISKTFEPSSYPEIFKDRNFIYFVISFFLFMIALPFITMFLEYGGLPTAFTGATLYIYYPLMSAFALLGGLWADRGRRSMTLISFLVLGLGFAIWGIVPESFALLIPILLIIWILLSIGNAISNVIDYIIPTDHASPNNRGKYIAVFFSATNVGMLISSLLQPYIITLPITTIALIVTSLLLFAITPTILTTEPLEEALSKEVEMKGVYVITDDGRCLVEMSFKGILVDVDLITSALSAVGGLIKESVHSEKRLQTIDHADVQILIEYGTYVNSAVIADKETPDLRARLVRFLAAFEKAYHKHIEFWTGDIRPFFEAYKMIERHFGIYLAKR